MTGVKDQIIQAADMAKAEDKTTGEAEIIHVPAEEEIAETIENEEDPHREEEVDHPAEMSQLWQVYWPLVNGQESSRIGMFRHQVMNI
jgi:hypothetical protein